MFGLLSVAIVNLLGVVFFYNKRIKILELAYECIEEEERNALYKLARKYEINIALNLILCFLFLILLFKTWG